MVSTFLSWYVGHNTLLLSCRHPDKNKDPEAKDKFLLVNKAYEVNSSIFGTINGYNIVHSFTKQSKKK